MKPEIHILFISGQSSGMDEIKKVLSKSSDFTFHLEHRPDFFGSIDLLGYQPETHPLDMILLDLQPIETEKFRDIFRRMLDAARGTPILVFTARHDHKLAVLALEEGAADNITKGDNETDTYKFCDAIEFSLIRQRISRDTKSVHKDEINNLRMDAASELHSVRKSNAANMTHQREQSAKLVERILQKGDDDIADAIRHVSKSLAEAELENAILYEEINRLKFKDNQEQKNK